MSRKWHKTLRNYRSAPPKRRVRHFKRAVMPMYSIGQSNFWHLFARDARGKMRTMADRYAEIETWDNGKIAGAYATIDIPIKMRLTQPAVR